ncbi:MAG: CHAD domain-containing protein [Gammaproteobacteria bacterium]|nr:CHAD domain-containing protein [Gammaproteobacteria bacterium]
MQLHKLLNRKIGSTAHTLEKRLLTANQKWSSEDIHQIRVTSRRLRSFLMAYKIAHTAVSEKNHTIEKALRRLTRDCGEVRNLDVAIQNAKTLKLPTQPLKAKRNKQFTRLLHQWDSHHKKKFVHVQLHPLKAELYFSPVALKKILLFFHLKLSALIKKHPKSKTELHRLRIQLKEIRYLLEALDVPVQNLKILQDHLGHIHDLETLEHYFEYPIPIQKPIQRELKKIYRLYDRGVLDKTIDFLRKGLIPN